MIRSFRLRPALATKSAFIVLCALAATALFGCKTTEENYRRAYEAVKQKETDGLEGTIFNRYRERAVEANTIYGSDTLRYVRESVRVTLDQGVPQERMKRYNIVVGQFKQLFHAKSMRDRFVEAGYPAAFIVQTGEPLYYVVAFTTEQPQEAATQLQKLQTSSPIRLADPCPWILSPNYR